MANLNSVASLNNGKAAPQPTMAQMQAMLDQLTQQNQALQAKMAKSQTISAKVSEKGALSIYGLGRFPTTLYREQWERLLAEKESILAFIKANSDKLATKD